MYFPAFQSVFQWIQAFQWINKYPKGIKFITYVLPAFQFINLQEHLCIPKDFNP